MIADIAPETLAKQKKEEVKHKPHPLAEFRLELSPDYFDTVIFWLCTFAPLR